LRVFKVGDFVVPNNNRYSCFSKRKFYQVLSLREDWCMLLMGDNGRKYWVNQFKFKEVDPRLFALKPGDIMNIRDIGFIRSSGSITRGCVYRIHDIDYGRHTVRFINDSYNISALSIFDLEVGV
jgi:hypothetical protein